MSTINSTALSSSPLLAQLLGDPTAQKPAPLAPSSATPTLTGAQQTQGARHHHRHGFGGLFSKIEGAVTTALQNAQNNGSTDPNKVIEDAIAQVFKDSGSTPAARPPAGKPDFDGDKAGSTGAAAGNGSSISADVQKFFDLLKSAGVDPAQFHKDFLAAIKDAQNGNADPRAALQSFPIGVSLDTVS